MCAAHQSGVSSNEIGSLLIIVCYAALIIRQDFNNSCSSAFPLNPFASEVFPTSFRDGHAQDWNRVLVSLISWPGQLLSLFPCERLKFLARMLFLGILSWTVVRMCWFRKSLPRSIYSISILLLEFIFLFVRPSEYIITPEVCAQGWYSNSGSTPVLFVEFGSSYLFLMVLRGPKWRWS